MRKPPQPYIGSLDGDRYISLADYTVDFSDWFDGMQFTIPAGEITDIASVPWWLRWLYDRASLGHAAPFLHDYLCEFRGKYINKKGEEIQLSWFDTHLMFLVTMRLDGVPKSRAFLAFVAVLICNRPIW